MIFYVQSALTVECLCTRRGWSLAQLVSALLAGTSGGHISYDFPELAESAFLHDCSSAQHHR